MPPHQQGISSAAARPEAKHGVRQDIFGSVKQPLVQDATPHTTCNIGYGQGPVIGWVGQLALALVDWHQQKKKLSTTSELAVG